MAVYKVIQDIESEDKLLGPLTFKKFIYAIIAGSCLFIDFRLVFIASPIKWLFILMFGLPAILFGVLASPLGRDQPTEVWLLSRIRFFLKPRIRIWDQEGMSDLVTVTAPKKVDIQRMSKLSPNEVNSRLKTLAMTLDTRGWAIKNVDVSVSVPELEANNSAAESDRLVGTTGMPDQMPVVDVHASDDIMDEKNNPTAKKFDNMMKQAETKRKHGILSAIKELVDIDEAPRTTKSKKTASAHKSTKNLPATKAAIEKAKKMTAAEKARRQEEWEAQIAQKLAQARTKFGAGFEAGRKKADPTHHIVGANLPPAQPPPPATPAVTAATQSVNMGLAQSGNAFSVATLSQLAKHNNQIQQTGPDEVTISLH
jgi:hypothetical protein